MYEGCPYAKQNPEDVEVTLCDINGDPCPHLGMPDIIQKYACKLFRLEEILKRTRT